MDIDLPYVDVPAGTIVEAKWEGITYRLKTGKPTKALDWDKLDEMSMARKGEPHAIFPDPGPMSSHPQVLPRPYLQWCLYRNGTLFTHCRTLLQMAKAPKTTIPVHLYFYYNNDNDTITLMNEPMSDRNADEHLHLYLPCSVSGTVSRLSILSADHHEIVRYLFQTDTLRRVEA